MEPSGILDNKSHSLQDHCNNNSGDFIVCDLGDEEVHFSRDPSDFYYEVPGADQYDSSYNNDSLSSQFKGSNANQKRYSKTSIHSLDTSNLDFGSIPNKNSRHQDGPHFTVATPDQIKSSKLLQAIGGKIRRGTNYFSVPTRLLGQYLLGITIQSWSEFFNTSRMMKAPSTRHQLTRRLVTNLNHFQGNYLCVSLILVIYCILTSPLLLVAIAAYLLTLYLVTVRSALGKQVRIFGYRLNLQQQYSFITMLSLPPLWIAGAPSAVFWVIGASFFVVGLHASMYTNDKVLNEQLAISNACAEQNEISLNRIMEPGQDGYTELGRHRVASKAPIQYYNHYPQVPDKRGYISLSKVSSSNGVTTLTDSSANSLPGSTTGASYVSSTLTQWMTFGGGGSRNAPTRDARDQPIPSSLSDDKDANHSKVPDVKIISRDYAGLGRVYEV